MSARVDTPVVFDPFADHADFVAVADEFGRSRFFFGAISTDRNLPIFGGAVDSRSAAVQVALRSVTDATGLRFSFVSSHLNLQTHGLDGAFHRDCTAVPGEVSHALTWYVHRNDWPVEYGGYLLIGSDPRDLRAVLPARNTAVLLPADVYHCAMAPSLAAGATARVSLTLKLRLDDAL